MEVLVAQLYLPIFKAGKSYLQATVSSDKWGCLFFFSFFLNEDSLYRVRFFLVITFVMNFRLCVIT